MEGKWDVVETYFECLVECDLDDQACHTECLIEFKEADVLNRD